MPNPPNDSRFRRLFPSEVYGERPVVILDGGMGTTLQQDPFNFSLDSNLWSSSLLENQEGRDKLIALHQSWISNGSEIIGSCTYQSSLPLFLDSVSKSHDHATIQQALETMNSAIPLVTRPYTTTEFKQRGPSRSSLSLGPFGAQLKPAQEYTGLYPDPFGRYSPSQIAYSPESASVIFPPFVPATDDTCEDALVGFHLGRLQDMSKSESFDLITMYAFETVPRLTEARAIRRAVAMFEGNRREDQKRPWYISFVFPVNAGSGEPTLPDVECKGSMMDEVVKATFGLSNTTTRYSRPDGIGINCTGPDHLPFLLSRLSTSLAQLSPPTLPWLVLYPDGGSVCDVITRSWSSAEGMNDLEWAIKLSDCVESALLLYGGIIAGGCCKAGMKAIRHLRVELEQRGLIL